MVVVADNVMWEMLIEEEDGEGCRDRRSRPAVKLTLVALALAMELAAIEDNGDGRAEGEKMVDDGLWCTIR